MVFPLLQLMLKIFGYVLIEGKAMLDIVQPAIEFLAHGFPMRIQTTINLRHNFQGASI